MPQKGKSAPDWVAIEGAYRAGIKSVNAIASEHGITEGAIRKRAKANGWARDPESTKRAIVKAHFSGGTSDGTNGGTNNVLRTIQSAADDDIADMERGLRINRLCLINLEVAAEKASDPKEIKIIVEAASAAVAGIRKIRGLDTPTPTDAKDIDAAIEQELAKLERDRQAGVTADA